MNDELPSLLDEDEYVFATGDTIGVFVDTHEGVIVIYKNGQPLKEGCEIRIPQACMEQILDGQAILYPFV